MSTTFLQDLRSFLIAQGIGRLPTVADVDPNNPLPPIWNEPRNGVPAPGEGKNATAIGEEAVLALWWTPGIPSAPYEGFLRTNAVTIWIRTKTAPQAHDIEAQLRSLLNDKRAWMMGNTEVNESMLFRDLAPVAFNDQGYSGNTEYTFLLWSDPTY